MNVLRFRFVVLLFLLSWFAGAARAAEVAVDADKAGWSVTSGANVLRLRRDGDALYLAWLGPKASAVPVWKSQPWQAPLLSATIEGKPVSPQDLRIESVTTKQDDTSARVVATLKHKTLPVTIEVACVGWSDTGVFWNEITLTNTGAKPLAVQTIASLALSLPGDKGELRYLDGPNPSERQLKSAEIGGNGFEMSNEKLGRSTRNISTWWSLYSPKADLSYTAQLAYSGNWTAKFAADGTTLTANVGMVFDNDGPLHIAGGKSFHVPTMAMTVSSGSDIDAGANALHRFQRRHVFPHRPNGDPLLVQYNTWYAFSGDVDAEAVERVLPLAANMGCEAFVIDANWHTCPGESTDWQQHLGDWVIDYKKFPKGLAPIIKQAHDRGMKFGLWLEPEVASFGSDVFREHPEWFLPLHGKPLAKMPSKVTKQPTRAHLDFSQPAVREHMMGVLDRLMREGRIDWFKFDYNIDIGNEFDARDATEENTRLHDHLVGYYQWLDDIARKYPHVWLENCASGGRRWDLDIARHTHTSWISDTVNPRYSYQVAYGATIEFAPETCNHWMIGDLDAKRRGAYGTKITSTDPEWWDCMFLIAMNGQTGISSRLDLWSPEALARGKQNLATYKRIRPTIDGADVYHLTGAPAAGYNPKGWMALQYNQPEKQKAVVLAYRLGHSEAKQRLSVKGLEPERIYEISAGGAVVGRRTGAVLEKEGLLVELPQEWRAVLIEIATANSPDTNETTPLKITSERK